MVSELCDIQLFFVVASSNSIYYRFTIAQFLSSWHRHSRASSTHSCPPIVRKSRRPNRVAACRRRPNVLSPLLVYMCVTELTDRPSICFPAATDQSQSSDSGSTATRRRRSPSKPKQRPPTATTPKSVRQSTRSSSSASPAKRATASSSQSTDSERTPTRAPAAARSALPRKCGCMRCGLNTMFVWRNRMGILIQQKAVF